VETGVGVVPRVTVLSGDRLPPPRQPDPAGPDQGAWSSPDPAAALFEAPARGVCG